MSVEKPRLTGDHVMVFDRTINVALMYPRHNNNFNAVEIELCDVRAADNLRIQYDYDRDGWSVQQATKFEWGPDEEPDPGWKEVYFAAAWALKD